MRKAGQAVLVWQVKYPIEERCKNEGKLQKDYIGLCEAYRHKVPQRLKRFDFATYPYSIFPSFLIPILNQSFGQQQGNLYLVYTDQIHLYQKYDRTLKGKTLERERKGRDKSSCLKSRFTHIRGERERLVPT